MRNIIIISILSLSAKATFSQISVERVLSEIERNNTTLAAYRHITNAEIIKNKTGLLPANPEAEFNYLWGDPEILGNRSDIAITQSFDFPTAYIYKSQIADMKINQAELEYQKQRFKILLHIRYLCSEITYYNALSSEYKTRLKSITAIANSVKRKVEIGEATILEQNRTEVNLLNTEKNLEQIEIKREALYQQLATYNAGKEIQFTDSVFINQEINPDFEKWFNNAANNNPAINYLKQQVAISNKEKQLQSALNMPVISAGYMSEKITDEHFKGITFGISIPLWENKNSIKYAKQKIKAAKSIEADAILKFYNQMKIMHNKTIALKNSIANFRQRMAAINNLDLLNKAFEKGEISLSEYYYELMVFYDNKEKLLEMEKDLQNSMAKLEMYN